MKLKKSTKSFIAFIVFSLVSTLAIAQTTGNLKGKIIERTTKQPIIGAIVQLDESQVKVATDTSGIFSIANLATGTYTLTISNIGFQTKKISDIMITAKKAYYAEFELIEDATNLSEVTIQSFKGENNPLTPVSTYSLSREEIFRNPGAQGDIMRALAVLPGVVSSGAQFSAIAARGQGTQDNVYMVDDIPMFNLSHLEAEGFNSGFNDPNGGRFSIFAPRVIDNVQFQNGGFDAVNGRKSSSLLNLGIKEGNRETWSFGAQFDLLGATLIADGPISKKTSLFASGRYQNLALLQNITNVQNPVSISFGDYMLKTTTQLNAKNKLSFITIYNPERPYKTIDDVSVGSDLNEDNSAGTVLFNHRGSKFMAGLNLRTLINTSSYWKNVLYYRNSTVDNNFGRFNPSIDSEGLIIDPRFGTFSDNIRNIINDQQEVGYRSIYTKKISDKLALTAGIDAMLVNLTYARTLSQTDTMFVFNSSDIRTNPNQYYQVVNPSQFNTSFNNSAFNGSGYATLSWHISKKFTLNPGLRYDYSGFNEQHLISPRISGSYLLNDKHSINFAAGIYFQDIAFSDVASQPVNSNLKSEESMQGILGYKVQFSPDLKLVAEGWYKQFYNLVVQPNRYHSNINDDGTGYAYGGDINLVKRLSRKYFGQIGYSYMVSKRDNNDGLGEYDYTFSVPHTFNILASYKPNNKWIFSGKFRYSTGRPMDTYIVHNNVLDNPNYLRYAQEITAINGSRLPDYFALDLRADYYIPMKSGTFSAFIDLANINNRFNVNSEIFVANTGQTFRQGLGIFPTFGLRVDL